MEVVSLSTLSTGRLYRPGNIPGTSVGDRGGTVVKVLRYKS